MTKSMGLPIKKNVHVIVFNIRDKHYNAGDIQEIVESSEFVVAWWNYFPGVYLVQLDCNQHEFAESIYQKIEKISLLVSKVEDGNFSGRLPGEAWLWLLDISDEGKADLKKTMDEEAQNRRLKNNA